jgi:AcrR family transcriptional regulator
VDGYQQRTEKKKEAIRRAAFALFCEYGLEKVSLAEIAKKAHVSPVTIYNYFGTKDQLVHAVVSSMLREVWDNRIRMLESDMPFPDKIKQMILEVQEYTAMMHADFLNSLMENDSELRRIAMDIYYEYLPKIMEFWDRGKQEGYIDPQLSTEAILMYFQIFSDSRISKIFLETADNKRLAMEMTQMFFYGLLIRQE